MYTYTKKSSLKGLTDAQLAAELRKINALQITLSKCFGAIMVELQRREQWLTKG